MIDPALNLSQRPVRKNYRNLIIIFILLALSLTILGYIFHLRDQLIFQSFAEHNLNSISETRIKYISDWRDVITTRIEQALSNPPVREELKKLYNAIAVRTHSDQLSRILDQIKNQLTKNIAIEKIYFISSNHNDSSINTVQSTSLHKETLHHATLAMYSKNVVLGSVTEIVGINYCAPVIYPLAVNKSASPSGAIILLVNISKELAGLFKKVEGDSSEAKFILARQEKDRLETILSSDGKEEDPAFSFILTEIASSLSTFPYKSRLFKGIDNNKLFSYLYTVSNIPDSDWKLLTMLNLHEALKPLRQNRLLFLSFGLAIILLVGIASGLAWQQEQKYQKKFRSDLLARSKVSFEKAIQSFIDISTNAIFLRDQDDLITNCNAAFEKLIGQSKAELIGANFYDIFINLKPRIEKDGKKPLSKSSFKVYEVVFQSAEGEKHDLLVAESLFTSPEGSSSGIIGQITDLTLRKKSEEELRHLKEFTDETIRTMTEGLMVTDNEGLITFANKAAANMLGYEIQELIGRHQKTIIAPDHQDIVDRMEKRRAEGLSDRYELDFIRKDGDRRTFLVSAGPRLGGAVPRGSLAIITDISERKKMEAEIKALSLTDELTGLLNRRGFVTLANQQLKVAQRMNKKAVLFFFDIDNLKKINDTLGHKSGDQAIRDSASLLKKNFREADIVARIGGDEFTVLSLEATEMDPETIIHRIQFRLQSYNVRAEAEKSIQLSLSVGYVSFDPEFPTSLDDLIIHADRLMYENKRDKKQN